MVVANLVFDIDFILRSLGSKDVHERYTWTSDFCGEVEPCSEQFHGIFARMD